MHQRIQNTQELVEALRNRRKDLGLSQTDLAKLCDLSTNGISKFESNKGEREIKLSTFFKLSQVLGVHLDLEFEE